LFSSSLCRMGIVEMLINAWVFTPPAKLQRYPVLSIEETDEFSVLEHGSENTQQLCLLISSAFQRRRKDVNCSSSGSTTRHEALMGGLSRGTNRRLRKDTVCWWSCWRLSEMFHQDYQKKADALARLDDSGRYFIMVEKAGHIMWKSCPERLPPKAKMSRLDGRPVTKVLTAC
jgi:hypothetical protein